MDFNEIGWEGVDGTYLAQDRDKQRAVVSPVMSLRISYNVGNFLIG
jgi:hypothetical protein